MDIQYGINFFEILLNIMVNPYILYMHSDISILLFEIRHISMVNPYILYMHGDISILLFEILHITMVNPHFFCTCTVILAYYSLKYVISLW